jgi:hypothetical protein
MYHNRNEGQAPMTDSPLMTVNAASLALGRDRRTIIHHLQGIRAEAKDERGRSVWKLSTIARALADQGPRGDSAAVDAIEAASAAFQAGFRKLQ